MIHVPVTSIYGTPIGAYAEALWRLHARVASDVADEGARSAHGPRA